MISGTPKSKGSINIGLDITGGTRNCHRHIFEPLFNNVSIFSILDRYLEMISVERVPLVTEIKYCGQLHGVSSHTILFLERKVANRQRRSVSNLLKLLPAFYLLHGSSKHLIAIVTWSSNVFWGMPYSMIDRVIWCYTITLSAFCVVIIVHWAAMNKTTGVQGRVHLLLPQLSGRFCMHSSRMCLSDTMNTWVTDFPKAAIALSAIFSSIFSRWDMQWIRI